MTLLNQNTSPARPAVEVSNTPPIQRHLLFTREMLGGSRISFSVEKRVIFSNRSSNCISRHTALTAARAPSNTGPGATLV